MRKFFHLFVLSLLGLFLYGCDETKDLIREVSIEQNITEFDENFKISDIKLKVSKTNGDVVYFDLTEDMIDKEDLQKLNTFGTHEIKVNYLNNTTTFTITIKGEKGVPGEKGKDGQEIELKINDGYIKWKYKDDTTWINLISLDELKGENGKDGITPTITISSDGYWIINDVKTNYKATYESNIQYYNVVFILDGGQMPIGNAEILENIERASTIELPIPTKEGFVFDGWYTGFSINDAQFTNVNLVTRDLTLYAKWKEDISPLLSFLNIGYSGNYNLVGQIESNFIHGNKNMNIRGTVREQVITTDQTITSYQYRKYEDNLDYFTEAFGYQFFDSNLVYKISYDSFYENWRAEVYMDNYIPEDPFDIFEFTKFIKKGENKYEYLIELDILSNFAYYINNITGYMGSIEVDLDEKILTIDLTIFGFYNGIETSEEINAYIKLLPLEDIDLTEAKIGANIILTDSIRNKDNFHFCTIESLEALYTNVNNIRDSINNSESLLEIVEITTNTINTIYNFELIFDELRYDKYLGKLTIESHFNYLVLTATIDSINNMNNLKNHFSSLIDYLPSSEGINEIVSQAINAINQAYFPKE